LSKRVGQGIVTPDELKRAIFLDYEKSMKHPPTLLGTLCADRYYAGIVEPLFATCANRYRAKNTEARDHLSLAKELLTRAEDEDRVLIAWSEHDYREMRPVLEGSPKLAAVLDERYRNALHTAKRLWRRAYSEKPESGALAFFAQQSGYAIPEKYGTNLVGDGLRLIRGQLEHGRIYPELTDAATKAWVTIVKHNRHDLLSMRHVLKWLHETAPTG